MTRVRTMVRMPASEDAWVHWLGKGCWALIEHGAFSAGGLLMNIVLIRWLSPSDYGAFTAVFTTFLLLSSLHTGLVVEPMLVFGPGSYKDHPGEYLRGMLRGHWIVSAAEGIVLLLAAVGCLLRGSAGLAAIFAAMAVTQAFIQLLWLMRQACYVHGAAGIAAVASLGNLALTLAGLWAVVALGGGAAGCLGVVAVSSLAAACWIGRQLGGFGASTDHGRLWRDIFARHWNYGRWGVASAVSGLAPAILCYMVFPLYASLSQSGALRAMSVIVMPAHLANTAVSRLLLPQLVRRRGTRTFGWVVGLGAILLTLGPLLYWLVLGLGHEKLIQVVYGGRFAEESNLLWLVGLIPLLSGAATLATAILSAYEKPALVFYANAIPGAITLVLGTALCIRGGIWGAAWANVLNNVWNVACLYVFLARIGAGTGNAATPLYGQPPSPPEPERECPSTTAEAQ